jgi:hypothetical protein
MLSSNAICAVTGVFIVGMVWLRTRMHYRRGPERLTLTRAGRIYFAVLVAVLVMGWLAAPAAGRALWPAAPGTPTLARVAWFLATYYLFIPLHRALRARAVEVFKVPVAHVQEDA